MSDEPFIERTFESGDNTITARFFRPTLAPGGEYQCQWTIHWSDRIQKRFTCGLDGVQALMLAMKLVHSELMESDLYKSGQLTFASQYDLDFPPSWGDGQLYVPPKRNGS